MEFVENLNIWFSESGATKILKHEPATLEELLDTKQMKSFDPPDQENAIFKILIVFVICHHKLQQKQYKGEWHSSFDCITNDISLNFCDLFVGTSMVSTASTVIVAIISRTIDFVVNKLKETLPLPAPSSAKENGQLKQQAKRRRRRRRIPKTGLLLDDELSDNSTYAASYFRIIQVFKLPLHMLE